MLTCFFSFYSEKIIPRRHRTLPRDRLGDTNVYYYYCSKRRFASILPAINTVELDTIAHSQIKSHLFVLRKLSIMCCHFACSFTKFFVVVRNRNKWVYARQSRSASIALHSRTAAYRDCCQRVVCFFFIFFGHIAH